MVLVGFVLCCLKARQVTIEKMPQLYFDGLLSV